MLFRSHHQADQQQAHAPVHPQRHRHQRHQHHHRGQMLAEDREQQGEEVIGAAQHDGDQPAGLLVGMEGGGELDDVLEEALHHLQPAAVGEAIGVERDVDAGGDADEAEAGPQADQPHRRAIVGERVDHPAEQHRLGEAEEGQHDAGEGEADRHAAIGPDQADGSEIETEEGHGARWRCSNRNRAHP